MDKIVEVNVGNLVFDCRTMGNSGDESILFLHGFPETSHMWKKLMSSFAEKGYYCVAPNLRGYSKGACPKGKKHYHIELLAGDILAISKALNLSRFHLVGHDWGAVIGWKVVHDHPELILSWTALSVPHIQAFGKAIVEDAEQRKMSQYVRDFQWPYLPERNIRKNDFKLFKRLWKYSDPKEVEDYLKVFRNPRQLTAALNYYRANYAHLKKASKGGILGHIQRPTLFIYGNRDLAIGSYAVKESHPYMKNEYEYLELEAGHWLIQTCYDEIEKAIAAHINRNKSEPQY
nr:alpha/beta hydrolase [Allomuricauda sp.]